MTVEIVVVVCCAVAASVALGEAIDSLDDGKWKFIAWASTMVALTMLGSVALMRTLEGVLG